MPVYRNIFLGLGSNLGDREKNLLLAIKRINERAGTVYGVSAIYRSEPWGNTDQPEFLNQVILLESRLLPQPLLEILQTIENDLGRVRSSLWGPRTLDIDILFFGDRIIREAGLTIPHPAIPDRKFVLLPMCELKPNFVHPALALTCLTLLKNCPDPLAVEIFDPARAK